MHIGLAPAHATGFEEILQQAIAAEAAGFDFLWLPEKMAGEGIAFDATLLASALATRTSSIGLIVTAAPARHEPYNLARRIASLDWISNGRIGWMIDAGSDVEREREYVELVGNLWDSWDDDAFIHDKQAGRFFTPEKMHVLDHVGPHFSVRGPLNVNRPPQGRPVIAAMSGTAAAEQAELVFAGEDTAVSRHGRMRVLGLADQPATMAELAEMAQTRQLDGFVLTPASSAEFDAIIARLGQVGSGRTGSALRDRLGLARPSLPASPEVSA
jgi:alkanesulfonate monooxygenase SsuD/methylene tetrahydromethanopterin reductase-like flavin-dependent oxidoreductase (luciferase family)